jgi:hypothetical protein
MKRIIAAAAVVATMAIASPASASTTVPTLDQFNAIHVGETKFRVEQSFGTTGARLYPEVEVDADGGKTVVKGYNPTGIDGIMVGVRYHKDAGQAHYHVVFGLYCQNNVCTTKS